MRYRLDFAQKFDLSAPSASGAMVGHWKPDRFVAWMPSTWPDAPAAVDEAFIDLLKRIFEESMLGEIKRVIDDAPEELATPGACRSSRAAVRSGCDSLVRLQESLCRQVCW